MRRFITLFLFIVTLQFSTASEAPSLKKGTIFYISSPYTEGMYHSIAGYYAINQDGSLIVPDIGTVEMAHTMNQFSLKAALTKLYLGKPNNGQKHPHAKISLQFIRCPDTSDSIKTKEQVWVKGHVKKSGKISIPIDGLSIDKVLDLAGGITVWGAGNRVAVFNTEKHVLNLKKEDNKSHAIKPGDIIHVPQKRAICK